jgi:PAS domain-containing protein
MQSEKFPFQILTWVQQPLLIVNGDLSVRFVNHSFAKLCGYSRDELLTKHALDLFDFGEEKICLPLNVEKTTATFQFRSTNRPEKSRMDITRISIIGEEDFILCELPGNIQDEVQ